MVNVQMLFPPAEKRLDMPAKFVCEHNLLRGQVETVGRNQVFYATGLETHDPNGRLGLLATGNAKNNFGVERGGRTSSKGQLFQGCPVRVFFDSSDKMTSILPPLIKTFMILVSSIQYRCLAGLHQGTDLRPFRSVAFRQD